MAEICEPAHIKTDEVDWNWSRRALGDYLHGNYERLATEDRYIAAIAVSSLASHARHDNLYQSLPFGTLICAGAVPRGAAVLAPLIRPREEGGYMDVSDLKPNNVQATRQTMSRLALGDTGLWTPHQNDYGAIDQRWAHSFEDAGKLSEGHVHTQDMRQLTPGAHHAIAVEHGPESATTEEGEYQEFMRIICDALGPKGILYMAYMLGSRGYMVGGVLKPAFPVTVDYVTDTLHANNMTVLANAGTDPSNNIREDGDSHAYDGMGVAVAVRK